MTGFFAYLKKELWEQLMTMKAVIICILFFLLGIISPIGAKYAPEVISRLTKDSITIQMADPTYLDAFAQFFKNLSQLGVIIFVIVFGNVLSQELTKGSLIIPMSKGLSMKAVIHAKFIALVFYWTAALAVSFLSCAIYTRILFSEINLEGVAILLLGSWIFGVFLISLIIFSNILCRGGYISLLLIAGCVGVLFLLNLLPDVRDYLPLKLVGVDVASALINQDYSFSKSGAVTCMLIVAFLLISHICAADKRKFCN
ncbi:MAG: ABC transporter permease [Lachnospiraceae bacterium]|nr:ABC transporter permease [Lachnospiraceae bacterium]